ncbi:MAG: hypothetical protein LQ338_004101 [Usnochroma carphineum]|nr:MAG: hypothetical protein LQ338_004101 [Usnochroma carphineum]
MLIEWQPKQRSSFPDSAVPPTAIPSPRILPPIFPLAIRESSPQSILKRPRVETDVDGEDSVHSQRKKRRLRLNLITSRLSQPYATPTTHIISRHSRRPLPWIRPRNPIRSPLRRAAILNAIRIKRAPAKNFGPKETNLLTGLKPQKELDHTEVDLITQGVRTLRGPMPDGCSPRQHLPPSPSPLGPSNYDALDEEDEQFEGIDLEEPDDGESVYSNFNDLDGADADIEDYDMHSPFSGEEEHYRPWVHDTGDESAGLVTGTARETEPHQHLVLLKRRQELG